MKGIKGIALILAAAILLGIFPNRLVTEVEADTSVTEATEAVTQPTEEAAQETAADETEAAVPEVTGETVSEETETVATDPAADSTVPDVTEIPDDTYPSDSKSELPEDNTVVIPPEIILPGRFPSVTFSNPAPMGSPIRGPQSKIRSGSASALADAVGDNLVLNKTVTDNGDETFTLTLESYATGTASVVTKVPVPTDVVLVLDESGSMNDCIECGHEMNVNCSSFDEGCLHKVFRSELNTTKQYRTYYKDGTERTVGYCSACRKWYTGGPFSKCASHGDLGNWVAFSSENDTNSYVNKVYITQFYAACDHDTQRMDALKGAVINFLNKMYSSSLGADGNAGTSDDVDNKVAIVGYDDDVPARIYTPKTPVSSGYVLADSAANAAGTLKSILSEKTAVMNGLDKVKVRSATATNRGMEAAQLILSNNPVPAGQERNRVVILFTDGSPGSGYNNNKNWANAAIWHAHTMKQTQGATIYTIGLFWGADASNPASLPVYDVNANGVNNLKFFQNGNRFLHLVSSNYPNATSLDATGAVASLKAGEGYYLSTDDEAGLYNIFGKLSNVVTPGSTTVTLDEKTVVKDVVTPYFDITQDTLITAWTESFRRNNTWTKDMDSVSTVNSGPLSVSVSGNTVSVSNFDYAGHYVAADQNAEEENVYRGKKLVIQIGIEPVAGFLGGDDIATNTNASAIYARHTDENPVKRFPVPDVDVSVKQIVPQISEEDIYLSQLSNLPEIINPGLYTITGNPYEVDSIRNGYVDVIYTISSPDGKTITCTIPAGTEELLWDVPEGMPLESLLKEDTTYRIFCQVISVNNREHKANYTGNATINVYRPEITFQDSAINLGQTADYQNNGGTVRWLHNGTPANVAVMGPAPVLDYTYSPDAAAFTADTPVKVIVTAKADMEIRVPEDQDITPYVTFWREGCYFAGCDHTEKATVNATDSKRINFVVHINTFNLRIEKSGADLTLDPNSSFLFRVSGPNQLVMDVIINGNGHVVIENLPVGEYTVTELTDWSWRYEPGEDTQTVHGANALNGTAAVHFANIRKHDEWLDGESYAENRFSYAQNQPEGSADR